jgi:undecaprenyl-diphosphatase
VVRGFACCLLSLAVLVGTGLGVCPESRCTTPVLDRAGLALAHQLSGGMLDWLMTAVTWLGSIWILLPLTGAIGIVLWRSGRVRSSLILVGGLLGAAALARVFKVAFDRPRPDLFPPLVGLPPDAAYPSAHTMQAVAAALALGLLVGRQRRWLRPVLAVAAFLVAWSRIHLQLHYPTDVLAGALAAVFWLAGLHRLLSSEPAKKA